MGQAFSEPVTEKETSSVKNDQFLVASSSIQGWRISMEDAHNVFLSMPKDPTASFFAVFDGHGGAKVAKYASENLHKMLCINQQYLQGRIEESLKSVFIEFDMDMFYDQKMCDEFSGSTAVVVLVKDGKIYCANIGDSRAVASFAGFVDALSEDHKPTCVKEMKRIVAAGGWVQFNRVNGNLALSRAFGDFVFKRNNKRSATEQIVIAYPDVQTRTLSSDLEFIIMACDGVWDVMANDEVTQFVRCRIVHRMNPEAICEELITRCLAPDCHMGSGIGCDNMTVILICNLNGVSYESFCERLANHTSTEAFCDRKFFPTLPFNIERSDIDSDSSGSSFDEFFVSGLTPVIINELDRVQKEGQMNGVATSPTAKTNGDVPTVQQNKSPSISEPQSTKATVTITDTQSNTTGGDCLMPDDPKSIYSLITEECPSPMYEVTIGDSSDIEILSP